MDVAAFFSLRAMPFAAGAAQPPISTPGVSDALRKIADLIDQGESAILLAGEPGTGKSFLLAELAAKLRAAGARACMPVDIRSINPGLFDLWDYLIVDEADRISGDQLRALAAAAAARGKRLIAAVSGGARPLPAPAPVVCVRGLARDEAVDFLRAHLDRAGAAEFPFDRDAAARLAEASAGSARALKTLAGAALVEAMVDDAHAVTPHHAERAVAQTVRPLGRQTAGAPLADADEAASGAAAPPIAGIPTAEPSSPAPPPPVPPQQRSIRPRSRWKPLWLAAPAAAALAALVLLRMNDASHAPSAAAATASHEASPAADQVEVARTTGAPSAPAAEAAVLVDPPADAATTAEPVTPERLQLSAARPRVIIRYEAGTTPIAAEGAYALAGMLERGGWKVAAVRPGDGSTTQTLARYSGPAERAAAEALAADVADPGGTRLESGGAPGTIEVWLPAG